MTYQEIVNKVAMNTGKSPEVVKEVYNSFWRFIREKIQDLPLKGEISEEEFNKLRTNFNIPSLGKLHLDYNRLVNSKKRFEYLKQLSKRC